MQFYLAVFVIVERGFATTRFDPTDGDPCTRLCSEYAADQRGAGFDLCDEPSRCIQGEGGDFCSHIYWSTTPSGAPGYFISTTDDEEDPSRPVSCMDAVRDIMDDFDFFHNGILDYARLGPIVGTIRDATSGLFYDIRQYLEQNQRNNLEYSTFLRVFNQLGHGMRAVRPQVESSFQTTTNP